MVDKRQLTLINSIIYVSDIRIIKSFKSPPHFQYGDKLLKEKRFPSKVPDGNMAGWMQGVQGDEEKLCNEIVKTICEKSHVQKLNIYLYMCE